MNTFVICMIGRELYIAANRDPVRGQFRLEAQRGGWRETRWTRDLIEAEKFGARAGAEAEAGVLLRFGWEVVDLHGDLRKVA